MWPFTPEARRRRAFAWLYRRLDCEPPPEDERASAEGAARLSLRGHPAPRSLVEWFRLASVSPEAAGLLRCCWYPSLAEAAGAELGGGPAALFQVLARTALPEPVVVIRRAPWGVLVLYLGAPDAHGELPILALRHLGERRAVAGLAYPGFDALVCDAFRERAAYADRFRRADMRAQAALNLSGAFSFRSWPWVGLDEHGRQVWAAEPAWPARSPITPPSVPAARGHVR